MASSLIFNPFSHFRDLSFCALHPKIELENSFDYLGGKTENALWCFFMPKARYMTWCCFSWYRQFPRQFFLAVKRPSWPVKLRLSAFNQVKFHLPFASRSMQFDLTFTLWRDFLDCLTFKIDDIILFEQGKHLLINIISIEILWDSKLIRFSRILYFLELLYFQNICNLFFFIINKEFNILETCRF